MKTLAEMQDEVRDWAVEKGWRGEGAPHRTFGDDMALLHTEVSEAVEAFRSHKLDRWFQPYDTYGPEDHVIQDFSGWEYGEHKPEGVPSEFADILIRLLDDCAEYGVDLEQEYEAKMAYNQTRSHRHGGKNL